MQFTYHKNAGDQTISIEGDLHKYLFKVRRHDKEKNLFFRNLKDDLLYQYKITDIGKRSTQINLLSSVHKIIQNDHKLHIGWCIIDPKNIEKQIASLNEIGVDKITFIYCQYSQSKYKINFEKLEKVLINSSQQSGRSSIIKLDTCNSLDLFLESHPETYMFNFSNHHIDSINKNDINTIVIGCEGGFSQDEIVKISSEKILGIDSNIILKSETAVVSAASKILL